MKKVFRYTAGYIIGFTFFIIIIPFAIYKLSILFDSLIKIKLINSMILRIILSFPFFLIGLIFQIWSNTALFFIGRGGPADAFGIAVSPRTQKLVVNGPYRYTRNPMVFGTFLIYFGLSVLLDSLICFIMLIVLLFVAVVYLKLIEEKRLLNEFKIEFIKYKNRVPMIMPFFHFKKKK
ncbi:MAG: isoprenylcysteine carboxylmethyltransferase family protein [Spirochaetes bacterium]|nr:isoprenylcysteine carboxylmethyltransferase family protein [Spirochaetota bacterium]